jgi:phosphonate transport system substrate-binding protein
VVLSVQAGKYDIGTIREGTLNVVANKIDINDIRVIASTRWYPGWVYAARKELKPAIIQNIKRALLKLDYSLPGHKKILDAASVRAIIPSDDKDFNPVRELAARIGISLDQ